jgi:hypothetical protein
LTDSDRARAWFIFDDALAPLLASFARGRRFERGDRRALWRLPALPGMRTRPLAGLTLAAHA